ncbi:hypothetical protein QT972_30010 [Microcoleus sp. herbarium7]|uniref:hypothetical protein n=1 Tax=Microcoleus sp. herbarium7 TaxID=3055435 RepID=UPI002FD48A84
MNPLILTKISKYTLIGSFFAYLSFASKFNPLIRQAFVYLMVGTIVTFLIASIWEGRDYLFNSEGTEDSLNTLVSGLTQQPVKRQYFLPAKVRLEIVITFVVIVVFALIGAI